MCVCVCACAHVCMCVCMHTCTYVVCYTMDPNCLLWKRLNLSFPDKRWDNNILIHMYIAILWYIITAIKYSRHINISGIVIRILMNYICTHIQCCTLVLYSVTDALFQMNYCVVQSHNWIILESRVRSHPSVHTVSDNISLYCFTYQRWYISLMYQPLSDSHWSLCMKHAP